MLSLFLIFVSALMLAIAATPVARRAALALGIIDQPAERKIHKSPIPLLGGLAIYTAFAVALAILGATFYVDQVVGILLGATAVSFLGIWDDWRGVRPLLKLAGQVLAALILIATGIQVQFLRNPVLDIAVTFLWMVGITNALNLIDNMDGLSGGVAAVAAAWFLALSIANGQLLVAPLAAALMGASLGFLVYNFNPASIFMGDAGSLFLGFLLAAVGIKLRFPGHSDVTTWMIPVLVLGIPIFDTSLVVISRLRRGLNPLTSPGRDHLSHRLVRIGLAPKRAVLCIYGIGVVLGALAFAIQYASYQIAYALFALLLLTAAAGIWRLEKI